MISLKKDVSSKSIWMPCPDVNIEYPGLAYIYPLDELIITQQKDPYHDIIGEKNTIDYTIFNKLGQKVFIAVERNQCKRIYLKIFNHYGNEVIHVEKPYELLRPCRHKVLVWSPPGNFVGVVREYARCVSTFGAKNWYGSIFLTLKAKGYTNYEYSLKTKDGIVGKVMNNWAVLNVKNFGVTFPNDMNVLDKAVLIGACFLISWLKYRKF